MINKIILGIVVLMITACDIDVKESYTCRKHSCTAYDMDRRVVRHEPFIESHFRIKTDTFKSLQEVKDAFNLLYGKIYGVDYYSYTCKCNE